MSCSRHHAIIVTSFSDDIEAVHRKASKIFPNLSALVSSEANGFRSFFIPPDGSKEEWPTSNKYDAKRDKFIRWLREQGDPLLDWAEVQFGDDGGVTKIVRSSDDDAEAAGRARTAAATSSALSESPEATEASSPEAEQPAV